MLGGQHGDPEIVDDPQDRSEGILGCRWVERRGRLVEHQHPRVERQHGRESDPLLLPARQRAQRPAAQPGDAHQVEHLLDPTPHCGRRDGELLHAIRQLILDDVGNEPGQRVLAHDTDGVGELARRMTTRVPAVDPHRPLDVTTRETGYEPVHRPQQRRLAASGQSDHQREVALANLG